MRVKSCFLAFFAMLAVLFGVLFLPSPALAEDLVACPGPYSITIHGKDGITNTSDPGRFVAYQVFAGDVAAVPGAMSGSGILSNAEWGDGIADGNALLSALKESESWSEYDWYFEDCASASDVVRVLSEQGEEILEPWGSSKLARAFASYLVYGYFPDDRSPYQSYEGYLDGVSHPSTLSGSDFVISGLEPGYYVVVDLDVSVFDDPEEPFTDPVFHLAVSEPISLLLDSNCEVTLKAAVPTVKKITTDPDLFAGVGDVIPFEITATLPENLESYEHYEMEIKDNVVYSDSMFIDMDSIQVFLDDTLLEENYDYTTCLDRANGEWFEITINNLRSVESLGWESATASSVIKITYTATLGPGAAGPVGNTNSVVLTYPNNPNVNGEGSKSSVFDEVDIYTLSLDIEKQNGTDGGSLAGAKFRLQRLLDDKYVTVDENGVVSGWVSDDSDPKSILICDEAGHIDIDGLDAGAYTLTEIESPAGFDRCLEELEFTLSGSVQEGSPVWSCVSDYLNAQDGQLKIAGKDGIYTATILNYRGVNLPGTGGSGTTWFYIVGGVVCLAAAAVFVVVRARRHRLEAFDDEE